MDAATTTGGRLIVSTLDEQAQSRPNQVFYSIPKNDDDLSEGFVDITCSKFSNAVNHAAVWLAAKIGEPSGAPCDVIAYQGPNDLRYPILAIAASKLQKMLLVPFPLAPPLVKQHLLSSTQCRYLLHTAQENEQVQSLLQGNPYVQSIVVPGLDTWLHAEQILPYPCSIPWQEMIDNPWLIFHTTGTTGLPKIVTYTNRMMASFEVARSLPGFDDSTQLGQLVSRRCYAITPMSHFSGLCAVLQTPVFLNGTVVTGPKNSPPTPLVIADTLRYSKAEGLVTLPFLLRAMVNNPQTLEILRGLEFVQWVGAALDPQTGNMLSSFVKLCPAMGTTECGPYFLNVVGDAKNWAYYSFQSGQGIHFVERADNLFELVFKKSPDAVWQQVFLVFPNLDVYETKDLFRKHVSKEGLWAYVGRSDDIIVLANSANINATTVEEKLTTHPSVHMALVGGSGRSHSFAIIELTLAASGELEQHGTEAILIAILPVIEEANRGLSPYTRLHKELILFTDSTRPLSKSPKGSLMRDATIKSFTADIDQLFATLEARSSNIFNGYPKRV